MHGANSRTTSRQHLLHKSVVENGHLVSHDVVNVGQGSYNFSSENNKEPKTSMGSKRETLLALSPKTSLSEFIGDLLQIAGFPADLAQNCAD